METIFFCFGGRRLGVCGWCVGVRELVAAGLCEEKGKVKREVSARSRTAAGCARVVEDDDEEGALTFCVDDDG